MKKFRVLIHETSIERVAHGVFVAELHGYHSRRFSSRLVLPSMEYTRSLVRAAIARGTEIVVMRGLQEWSRCVPELKQVRNQVVRNVQNPTISPGNLEDFHRIVAAI